MAKLALLLWLLYGASALGIRVAIQWRRTGSTGLVGIKYPFGSMEWLTEAGISAAIAAGLAAPVLDLAGAVDLIEALDRTGVHVAGVALFAVGLTSVIWSQAAMGSSWRIGTDPDERTELVTGGVFAVVRNPIYASLVPTLLGLALLVPNPFALASVAIFLATVEALTRLVEEPHLLRVHGEAYARYAARVGRFLPRVGRIKAAAPQPDLRRLLAGQRAERSCSADRGG